MQTILPEIFRSLISARCRKAEAHLSNDVLLFIEPEYYAGWRDHPLRLSYIPTRFAVHLTSIIDDLIWDDAFVYAWDDGGRADPIISWNDMDKYDLEQWIRAQLDLRIDAILASLGNHIHAAHERSACLNFDVIITGLVDWSFHSWKSGTAPPLGALHEKLKTESAQR